MRIENARICRQSNRVKTVKEFHSQGSLPRSIILLYIKSIKSNLKQSILTYFNVSFLAVHVVRMDSQCP